jgi:signal-transduction protein with cAMP-binding, CBS, and nucleotidyltransferase domain
MRAIDAVRKPPVTIAPEASIAEAARLMDTQVVGALIVMDGDRPVGVVTDRDIAIRAVARDVPADARVDAIMSHGVIALNAGEDLRHALPIFRSHAIRRLPLVRDGHIVGMLTTDDLLIDLVADLGDLVRPITGQVVFGYPERSDVPARRDSD